MPQDLRAIVQRMVDAGEPEANIAAVIKQVSAQKPGFFDSLLDTVNPMNLVRSIPAMIPGTEANHAATIKTLQDASDHPFLSGLSAGASQNPLTGGAGMHAGRRIGSGDIAGGAGEAIGDLVNASVPAVVPKIPGAINATGRGLEAVGAATRKPLMTGGMIEGIAHNPVYGAAVAGAPYAAEYAGKGLQRLGDALGGLSGSGQSAFNELPLYKQMESLPTNASGPLPAITRTQTPAHVSGSGTPRNPATAPRLQKNFGASLEDRLASAVRSVSGAESPTVVSGAPEQTMTSAGKPAVGSTFYDFSTERSPRMVGPSTQASTPAPPAVDLPAEFQPVDAPVAPRGFHGPEPPSSPPSMRVNAAADGMAVPYSDWSSQIDDIVNAAASEGLPESKTGWLARSRLSNAEKAWLDERAQTMGRPRELSIPK